MYACIHGRFYDVDWLFLCMSKGSKRRPGNQDKYAQAWEKIFGEKIMVETPTEDGGPWSVVIYGKEQCPYCDMAKKLAEQRGYKYVYKQLGVDFELHEMLEKVPTARTFPQIFVNDKSVGGYTEFSQL